jgi:hypothetical protein
VTAANVHGEVVGEGRTKGLKNRKSILRMTEPRLGLRNGMWTYPNAISEACVRLKEKEGIVKNPIEYHKGYML